MELLLNMQILLIVCAIYDRCHAVTVYFNAASLYKRLNEELREGGLDIKAEDIIDIIDGYQGEGCGTYSRKDLGGYQ